MKMKNSLQSYIPFLIPVALMISLFGTATLADDVSSDDNMTLTKPDPEMIKKGNQVTDPGAIVKPSKKAIRAAKKVKSNSTSTTVPPR